MSAHLLSPHYAPLHAMSVEWRSSTKGRITGEPLYVSITTPADFAKYRGTLKGRIVLYQPPRKTAPHFAADARRHDGDSLEALASYPIPDEDPPSADYARGFLDDPRWAWHAAERFGVKLAYPPQYARSHHEVWPGAALARPRKAA